jgi:hypothetical protein
VPLCAGIYLLCYLDRSNIGNAKTLNANLHHDLLSDTNMTALQYTYDDPVLFPTELTAAASLLWSF